MYNSPNKSLELATLKRTLMTEMGRTKSGRVTKKRRRKRAYKSTAPKVSQNKTYRPNKWTTYWPTDKTKYKVAHPHLQINKQTNLQKSIMYGCSYWPARYIILYLALFLFQSGCKTIGNWKEKKKENQKTKKKESLIDSI